MISSDQLCQVLYEECRRDPSHGLTSWQEQLVGVVCRLPDLLANRMGHQLHHSLLPRKYFAALSRSVLVCLEKVHGALQGGFTTSPALTSSLILFSHCHLQPAKTVPLCSQLLLLGRLHCWATKVLSRCAICCCPQVTAVCLVIRCCVLSARSCPGAQSGWRPTVEEDGSDFVCPCPHQLP